VIVVGERINASRKAIGEAVKTKDAEKIKQEAKAQKETGANYIDVNCGTSLEREPEDLLWLVETAQSAVDLPLCLDSPNPEALKKALPAHKGKPIINSITAEEDRAKQVLPLVKEYDAYVVGLAVDEKGIPKTAEERFEIAKKISDMVLKAGIDKEKLFIDSVVQPIGTDSTQGAHFLRAVSLIKQAGLKTIAGTSNISFGLPQRSVLNAAFLTIAISLGLDAAIIDITDKRILSAVYTALAIVGKDEYCQNYLKAFREEKIT